MLMTCPNIRNMFIGFFKSKGHHELKQSSVVPVKYDPTLLFINSGMAAMKDYFAGVTTPPSKRIVTCQPCLRVGGKHNDLEEVGKTTRHHTFFEMLGNFSFGEYGRDEAVQMAWEFLTAVLHVKADKLWITVHPEDEKSREAWQKIGVASDRILKVADSVWAAGDIGPRGYCTEIFYDFGPQRSGELPDCGDTGDRYIEIWNIVLMGQYVDKDGMVRELPAPCVDTGMGLERIEAVLRNSYDSYDSYVISECMSLAPPGADNIAVRIIADHARAAVFLIADGIYPGASGREYVLRRILRRALKHQISHDLDGLMKKCALKAIELMSVTYPHLATTQSIVQSTLDAELEKFRDGWQVGSKILDKYTNDAIEAGSAKTSTILPGDTAFKLYDTYGFPLDMTEVICGERGFIVDHVGFEKAMQEQRNRSRCTVAKPEFAGIENYATTQFLGYEALVSEGNVIGCFDVQGKAVDRLDNGGWLVLDRTPFYATAGGQAADHGYIDGFPTVDVQKIQDVWLHQLERGAFKVGQPVQSIVDPTRRARLRVHHSTVHLLCAALRQIDPDVGFCGSAVMVDKCRLDFTYNKQITAEFLSNIENTINNWIALDIPSNQEFMSFKDAIDRNAGVVPGAQYPNIVRVITFGDIDIQLCGGTHVKSTAELSGCKIIECKSIAASTKRIVAKSGLAFAEHMVELTKKQESDISEIAKILRTSPKNVVQSVKKVADAIEKGL